MKKLNKQLMSFRVSLTLAFIFLFGLTVISCSDTPSSLSPEIEQAAYDSSTTERLSFPEFDRWETQMLRFGERHCSKLEDPRVKAKDKVDLTYYDAAWVYYQIAEYTQDPTWLSCAEVAGSIYRNHFVIPKEGNIPGFWNFTHGLTEDYFRSGDNISLNAVVLLSENAAFSRDSTKVEETVDSTLSREVAYAIMGYLNAEELGESRRPRLKLLVNQALDHIDQWVVTKEAPFVKPFMVGLTAHALIMYYQKTKDPRVVPALTKAMDWIWNNTWLPKSEAFMYLDRVHSEGGMEPTPDLNLLIAPAYAWLYLETGEARFRDRGDQIFAGGVKYAWLERPKQFNQSYRWSFDYVKWRLEKS